MQIMSSFFRFVVALCLALMICLTAHAATLYVDDSAPSSPTPDGSLTKPYLTIQDAVAVAQPNQDIILVGQGTYTPTAQTTGYIQLKDRVRIEGGYLGWTGSTFVETRDPATYVTILSGDLGGGVHARHVVVSPLNTAPPSSGTVAQRVNLDGVTITAGSTSTENGGGILIQGALNSTNTAAFRNCIITGNTAVEGGGVFADAGTHPVFRKCTFVSNTADLIGTVSI